MCDKRNKSKIITVKRGRISKKFKTDKCLELVVGLLNLVPNNETVGCCCGHGKYPPTILVKFNGMIYPKEIFSQKIIKRKKRFYKKDKEGYYFIPEVSGEVKDEKR